MKKTQRLLIIIAAALFLVLIFGQSIAVIYTDWLWFKSLNLSILFSRVLKVQVLLGLCFGLISGLLFYLNGILSNRWGGPVALGPGEYLQFSPMDRLADRIPALLKGASILIGLVMAFYGAGQWNSFLNFFYGIPFGKSDPLFAHDIGFYVFKLPFIKLLIGWLFRLLFLMLVASLAIFVLRLQIILSPEGINLRLPAKRYLLLFGGGFFLLTAAYFVLARYNLLYESRGVVFGASYADENALLPALNVMAVLSIATAGVFLYNFFRYQVKVVYGALAIFVGIYILGVHVYPMGLQRFVVAPNEIGKETPYLVRDIAATRYGYGLAEVEERDLSATASLTPESLARNDLTIKNIRLWDHQPLLETYSQIQEIRTYYKFLSVDNDRYYINGEYRQVMLSPRELSYADLPSRVWINEHLMYTHGYGLTLGVVNQVTREGLPALLIQDIPPVSKTNLKVDRPGIYFGETDNDYILVNTRLQEFDYPSGEQNVFTRYQGKDGIQINSILDKALWAFRFNALKILLSTDVRPGSRILFDRAVRSRLEKLVPFLQVERDPYMVVSGGRLYWLVDAYTNSDLYPYSRRVKGVGNYIRNSVVAVLDAYDGNVEFYVKDASDPLIRTYAKMFPGVFKPLSALSSDLRSHLRYPHWLFRIQANIYNTYHMTEPQTFYNKEDLWSIPGSLRAENVQMEPYYTIMKLPGERKEEFILMTPFNPSKKGNLAAWMCAKCDPDDYGKLVVYRFPKQKLVYGPRQIESRINQEPEISRQLSLWDQRGSSVIPGTLLVIPIEESLIYVQPIYLKAETGQIPELKRVIVAYENAIAMEERLEQSLARLFGTKIPEIGPPPVSVPPKKEAANLGEAAWRHFQNARRFLKEENWVAYGEELRKLEEVLKRLKEEKTP